MIATYAKMVSRGYITILQSFRTENEFKLFWAKIKKFAIEHNIDKPPPP